jgi:hypothetical protein
VAKNGKRLGFLPGWRVGTYIVLAFNILMLVWLIAGVASATHNPSCGHTNQYFTKHDCQSATDAGATIGAGILIFLWAIGDVILGVLWLVTNRKKTRECPACGTDVKKGLFTCRGCGFDFRSVAYAAAAHSVSSMPVTPPPAPTPQVHLPQQTNVSNRSKPTTAEIRKWARDQGYPINDKGRVPSAVVEAYQSASV